MEMQTFPEGLARTLGYARALMTKAVIVFGIGAVAELTAPHILKPSVLFGTFSGRHDQAQLEAARAAQVETARQIAIVQAAPPATYQQETIILQQQQQALASTFGTQSLFANLGDAACIAARLWNDPGRDWRELRDTMRDLGCGLGDELRGNMVGQLSQAGRAGGAIVPRTAAPDPARMPAPAPLAPPRPSPVAPPVQQTRWVRCPSVFHSGWDSDGAVRQACSQESVTQQDGSAWLDCEIRSGNRVTLIQTACARLRSVAAITPRGR